MTDPIGLGYSTCPNDTFMFHAMVHGLVDTPASWAPWLADIEELNRRAQSSDPLPVTKVSASALTRITDTYTVLSAGAALGRGNGPLVLRRAGDEQRRELADLAGATVAIPGEATTANLLLSLFGPRELTRKVMRFDAIMPAVARGEVDAGLVIHESRFTYPDHGLACIADLGTVWEQQTDLPLPLGVIVAHRDRGLDIDAIEASLRASVQHAFAHPAASADYIREHAAELSPEVCRQHIALYVGPFSVDLGDEGRYAIDELLARARAIGASPASPWR